MDSSIAVSTAKMAVEVSAKEMEKKKKKEEESATWRMVGCAFCGRNRGVTLHKRPAGLGYACTECLKKGQKTSDAVDDVDRTKRISQVRKR